jgi:outer membrane receptor protein involved in Fe transport
VLNLRFGTQFDAYDISLFVNNVTNAAPDLALTSSTIYDPQDWQNVTLRPRSYGLTMTFHK